MSIAICLVPAIILGAVCYSLYNEVSELRDQIICAADEIDANRCRANRIQMAFHEFHDGMEEFFDVLADDRPIDNEVYSKLADACTCNECTLIAQTYLTASMKKLDK